MYWVAQMCNADACGRLRIAKDSWRTGEVVKELNSGAQKNSRDSFEEPESPEPQSDGR